MNESMNKRVLREASPYNGSLTREQFLFYEMRTTAKMMEEGLSKEEILEKIEKENLFQYPTERMLHQMGVTCLKRLDALGDDLLVTAIANKPMSTAKQICLYAMMKQYRLMWDFMITVIGEKYRQQDMHFNRTDLNAFFLQLQEQDDWVACWSETTVTKIKSVIMSILVENEYIDGFKSTILNPVLIDPILEKSIRDHHDEIALCAFNVFA